MFVSTDFGTDFTDFSIFDGAIESELSNINHSGTSFENKDLEGAYKGFLYCLHKHLE